MCVSGLYTGKARVSKTQFDIALPLLNLLGETSQLTVTTQSDGENTGVTGPVGLVVRGVKRLSLGSNATQEPQTSTWEEVTANTVVWKRNVI